MCLVNLKLHIFHATVHKTSVPISKYYVPPKHVGEMTNKQIMQCNKLVWIFCEQSVWSVFVIA